MSEPTSTGIGAALGWKAIGGAAGAVAGGTALGTVVVMLMTKPRTEREWAVALISSAVSSIGGGAATIMHFSLQHWFGSFVGLMAIGGLFFACALPGWVLVRIAFNTMNRWQDKTAPEVAAEVKGMLP